MNVSSVSSYALRLLGACSQGTVRSVFATSFNVELAGTLVHVGTDAAPLSCFGMTVAAEEMPRVIRAIEVGDAVVWDGAHLELHAAARTIVLNLSSTPVRDLSVPRMGVKALGNMDAVLFTQLGRLDLPSRIGLPWEGEVRSQRALASLARFSSLCYARELGAFDAVREESAARAMCAAVDYLVGRGLGLTPSGDDVLMGFGCGMLLLYGAQDYARVFFEALVRAFPGKTTAVSEAYLTALGAGYANEDYVALCSALAAHEVSMLPARVARVLEVGHTSGSDGLLGFGAAFCCLI